MSKDVICPEAISAPDAYAEAQQLAFAPIVFQAARALRDLGILAELDASGASGMTAASLADKLGLSEYGARVLLESGLSAGLVGRSGDGCFVIRNIGQFLLHDPMTRINMDFTHYVCYRGMYDLDRAIRDGRPRGLRSIDKYHSTFYEAFPNLADDVRSSWRAFDHFYSDAAFPAALEIVLSRDPKTLVDIGANTGRFSVLAAQECDSLQIAMVDLPDQLKEAMAAVDRAGLRDRIAGIPMDVRADLSSLPVHQDTYWLSQFLCCFGDSEIVALLKGIAATMSSESRLYVLETCWDRQEHQTAAYALANTSPYFTCIANGNSKMYAAEELMQFIAQSGLECERIADISGSFHTLFECCRPRTS